MGGHKMKSRVTGAVVYGLLIIATIAGYWFLLNLFVNS